MSNNVNKKRERIILTSLFNNLVDFVANLIKDDANTYIIAT